MKILQRFLYRLILLSWVLASSGVAKSEGLNDQKSGFIVLSEGVDAFHARLSLINQAKQSLDLQYYIWHQDKSGRAILSAILDAADRGVHVRLLVDDMNLAKDRDLFRSIDRHPLVEVRLFNPLKYDGTGLSKVARAIELMLDFQDKNRRMHNKMLLADRSRAILGGRNIGDEYFDLKENESFRDLDLYTEGPISDDLTATFESYWNNPISCPFYKEGTKEPQDEFTVTGWQEFRKESGLTDKLMSKSIPSQIHRLEDLRLQMIWAAAEAMADSPKIFSGDTQGVEDQLKKWPEPTKTLLVESAYFIPTDALLSQFRKFLAKGVHIQVLTNSLQSNDVLLAHAGYMGKREDILRMGIDLFEWRHSEGKTDEAKKGNPYGSQAGLHSKTFVIDDEYVFVGSVNLDGRSIHINTENGLMVHSREMARQVSRLIAAGMSEGASWKLSLSCKKSPCDEDDKTVFWRGEKDGQRVTYDEEPEESFWLRTLAKALSYMPMKSAL
jgi:putative cardiolipin synthase